MIEKMKRIYINYDHINHSRKMIILYYASV